MGFDKYGSGGHLYVPGVSETADPVSIEQAFQNLKDALIQAYKPVLDTCVQIVQNIMDALTPQVQQALKEIVRLCDLVLESYPDKRIVWLALHHKKERIRKKNRNRILKWIERNVESGNKTNR